MSHTSHCTIYILLVIPRKNTMIVFTIHQWTTISIVPPLLRDPELEIQQFLYQKISLCSNPAFIRCIHKNSVYKKLHYRCLSYLTQYFPFRPPSLLQFRSVRSKNFNLKSLQEQFLKMPFVPIFGIVFPSKTN